MQETDADSEWAAQEAKDEAKRQRKAEPPPVLDPQAFVAWRSPRIVTAGPVRLDNPLWHWLVRTRLSAFSANELFRGPSPFDAGPMWCFDRFGRSETLLPDGRVVHVGGEHEDYYDPDFFIYNDVTVVAPDNTVAIHGYGREKFPPTDFHSATLVGTHLYLIGCLGYPEQRVAGHTPVFRLSLDTMDITPVETTGASPGWISRHSAELAPDGQAITVSGGKVLRGGDLSDLENIDRWSLDLASGVWSRVTALDWQRWTMMRSDRKRNRLWDVRQELWHRQNAWPGLQSYWKHDDEPDFEALAALYCADGASPVPCGEEHNVYRVAVDGVTVKFTEDSGVVQALVEGKLSHARLQALQRSTIELLQRLDASDWEIEAE